MGRGISLFSFRNNLWRTWSGCEEFYFFQHAVEKKRVAVEDLFKTLWKMFKILQAGKTLWKRWIVEC